MIPSTLGIGLAFIAMLSWGFGDFFIQKSTRKLGDWETLFFITSFGTIVLIPFVWKEFVNLVFNHQGDLFILVSSALVLTLAAIFQLEGFKKGKISVLEPLMSFEILSAGVLSFFILGDKVSPLQIFVILALIVGLFLVSFKGKVSTKNFLIEKGVYIFIFGAIFMGGADFLLGWGSRVTDPIVANFVLNICMMVISGLMMILHPSYRTSFNKIKDSRGLILIMSVADNIGWIAYALAMTIVPIAVATGMSEASVIIAVLLGLFINKEKLQKHQKVGLVIALTSVVVLAFITAN